MRHGIESLPRDIFVAADINQFGSDRLEHRLNEVVKGVKLPVRMVAIIGLVAVIKPQFDGFEYFDRNLSNFQESALRNYLQRRRLSNCALVTKPDKPVPVDIIHRYSTKYKLRLPAALNHESLRYLAGISDFDSESLEDGERFGVSRNRAFISLPVDENDIYRSGYDIGSIDGTEQLRDDLSKNMKDVFVVLEGYPRLIQTPRLVDNAVFPPDPN